IRLTSLFLSGHVPDHTLTTAVRAGQVTEPEDLHHSGSLVNGLLPATVPEVAVVHVRTELDVLRIEEPDRPFRAVAVEDHVDATEANLVEARIGNLNRLIPLLGLEQLPEPVPKLRRGHDQVRALRAVRAAGDHVVYHRKGQRLTLSVMVLGLPPRMLRTADTAVEINVRAVVHSSQNARDVLAVVARAVAPQLLREHIPEAQAGDFHLRLQEVQHSQVAPVLRFLKVGD